MNQFIELTTVDAFDQDEKVLINISTINRIIEEGNQAYIWGTGYTIKVLESYETIKVALSKIITAGNR